MTTAEILAHLDVARESCLSSVAALGNFGMTSEHHRLAARNAAAAPALERLRPFVEAAMAKGARRLKSFPPPMHPTKHLNDEDKQFDLTYRALIAEGERSE